MSDEQGYPSTPSSVYQASIGFWNMVNAILGGPEAMRATSATSVFGPALAVPLLSQLNRGRFGPESPYLPRFPRETAADYDSRRRKAFLTSVYGDLTRSLVSKPFARECNLVDDSGDDLKTFAENIDGLGNNLHVFSRNIFEDALHKGITWVLVDYTKVPAGATLAAERDMGARPYFVHVPAERMIAVYSKFLNGKEIIFHARIDEPCTELDGYKEEQYRRVRELKREPILDGNDNVIGYGPATWTIKEEVTEKDSSGKETTAWVIKDSGPITVGFIPLVPLIIGKRIGTSWKVEPWSRDLAYMQVKLFQQESNLDWIKELTAFPMLAGNGVNPRRDGDGDIIPEITVGPGAVLYAPMDGEGRHGEFLYIGPPDGPLTFLETSNEKYRTEMRDLGMQPLATHNITIVTSKNVSLKANSQVQAWGLQLKDSLEQQWKYFCIWLGQKIEPEVNVHLDFGVELEAGPELEALSKAEAATVISKRLYFNELKRRGVLADDADWEDDQEVMAEQQQGLEPEQPIDPRTGAPLAVDPVTGRPVVSPPKLVKA